MLDARSFGLLPTANAASSVVRSAVGRRKDHTTNKMDIPRGVHDSNIQVDRRRCMTVVVRYVPPIQLAERGERRLKEENSKSMVPLRPVVVNAIM